MSALLAIVLWIAAGLALKSAMLAQNREYRRDYGRTLGFTPRLWLLRKWPVREIGWYVAVLCMAPLFLSMIEP